MLAVAALLLTTCSGSSPADDSAESKTLPSKTSAAPTGLAARQAAAVLAEATGVTTLGDPTDNTTSRSGKAAGEEASPSDCLQLITTDTVSIYEYPSPGIAAHRVEYMATEHWRQVGRFALAWSARDQKLIDDSHRTDLVKAIQRVDAVHDLDVATARKSGS
ncbi:hypothetical protein GCM10010260_05640 [Streptomyces filipinensis]|uniref:Lipoprotein n=1 Tax=Streptomyces filipinensis TaxID=66887 RepID=A0A918M973_9ACTN|nr:hypothetical protein [Streptomyces filipinensis]GGU76308.1 hypothetical protein GCM10010260_05640 [Streptomyces filipinensis]